MYDLLNLQIAEAASTTGRPVFEVAEITDNYLLLLDLRLRGHGSINQYPDYVISLLSQLRILAGRRIFFNGVEDKLYELTHENGKFGKLRQRSENKSVESRMYKLMQVHPDFTPYKKPSLKKSREKIYIPDDVTEKEICDYLNGFIRAKSNDGHQIFTIYGYSDAYIYIYEEKDIHSTSALSDAAWLIATLYETGYLENRRVFYRNSFAGMIELKHQDGKYLTAIHAEQ
jgi:hypothetical protein